MSKSRPTVRQCRQLMLGVCLAAFLFILWNGRHQYFVYDEWSYWTERLPLLHAHDYGEYFNGQHVGHWHAVIMAVWLPLEPLFGLKSYLPYLSVTIVAHCIAGYLLFELLITTKIRPPIAVLAAATYLFLGSAVGDVSFGWQICFVTPIACCYLALLMVQRFADNARRWLAVVAVASLVLGVLASGVGVTMVVVAALAAALRRRFVLAAWLLTVPGSLYVIWRQIYTPQFSGLQLSAVGSYLSYARSGIERTIEGIVQVNVWPLAWLVFAAGAVGVVVAARRGNRYWSVYAATLIGSVVFYLSLSTQRFNENVGAFGAGSTRYQHVAGALMLPALALVIDQMIGKRRLVALAMAGLVAFALVGNARDLVQGNDLYVARGAAVRSEVAATVALGHWIDGVPATTSPYGEAAPNLTIGLVREFAADGKLPCDASYPAAARMAAKLGVAPPPQSAVRCP